MSSYKTTHSSRQPGASCSCANLPAVRYAAAGLGGSTGSGRDQSSCSVFQPPLGVAAPMVSSNLKTHCRLTMGERNDGVAFGGIVKWKSQARACSVASDRSQCNLRIARPAVASPPRLCTISSVSSSTVTCEARETKCRRSLAAILRPRTGVCKVKQGVAPSCKQRATHGLADLQLPDHRIRTPTACTVLSPGCSPAGTWVQFSQSQLSQR